MAASSAQPLVSIITASYNSGKTLEQALLSVQRQTYGNIEHVVIDGGSTDGTAEILRLHEGRLASWISEPDKGIADAWNKGLAKVKGEIIGTLNADDLYDPRAIETVVGSLGTGERCVTYGTTKYFSEDPEKILSVSALKFQPEHLAYGFGFMHTTCFAPRIVYDEVGAFDSRYRIAIDTDFLLRCHARGIPFRDAGNVTLMRTGGISQRRRTEAYGEFLAQLGRYGHPRLKILRARLSYWKNRALGRHFSTFLP